MLYINYNKETKLTPTNNVKTIYVGVKYMVKTDTHLCVSEVGSCICDSVIQTTPTIKRLIL